MTSFLVILLGMLLAVLAALGWLGLSQRRRRLLLAQAAHRANLRFSASDIFQLSRRYACFVLSQAGHSQLAENVIYGRYDRWQVRSFDYRFEVGHGPRRIVCRYSVMVADTDLPAPRTVLWDQRDDGFVPLAVQQPRPSEIANWWIVEGQEYAARLAGAFEEMSSQPLHLQAEGGTIIACSARRWKAAQIPDRLRDFALGLERLEQEATVAAKRCL